MIDKNRRSPAGFLVALTALLVLLVAGCTTRQVHDSLAGATAQQLMTYSIDELVERLPEADFRPYAGQRIGLTTHFVENDAVLRAYADERLRVALARRFDIEVIDDPDRADARLTVFYTALGTDFSRKGFYLPLGTASGGEEVTELNLITLEQFHGVAEMYYFVGEEGFETRGPTLQARTRTDALGLPIITIPISNLNRGGERED
jgi:hypothetical protein